MSKKPFFSRVPLSENAVYMVLYGGTALVLAVGGRLMITGGGDDGAAWFQAMGSVIALLVGIATLMISRRFDMRNRAREKSELESGYANKLLLVSHEVRRRITVTLSTPEPITKHQLDQLHSFLVDALARMNSNHCDDADWQRLSLVSELRWSLTSLTWELKVPTHNQSSVSNTIRDFRDQLSGIIAEIEIHRAGTASSAK